MKKLIAGIVGATMLIATPSYAMDDEKVLEKIHTKVNTNVNFRDDITRWDDWQVAKFGGYGDCEDFALLKRQMLIEAGWDEKDLVILILYRPTNKLDVYEGHAVLYVKSKNLILDSYTPGNVKANVEMEQYERYLVRTKFKFFCEVENITTGIKLEKVSERCKPRKKKKS